MRNKIVSIRPATAFGLVLNEKMRDFDASEKDAYRKLLEGF